MYRKIYKTIHGSWACIQPPFSAYRAQLTVKPSAPFERAENSGLEKILRFTSTLHLYMISAFEEHGNTYTSRSPYIPSHSIPLQFRFPLSRAPIAVNIMTLAGTTLVHTYSMSKNHGHVLFRMLQFKVHVLVCKSKTVWPMSLSCRVLFFHSMSIVHSIFHCPCIFMLYNLFSF
jgi:hypothetical protein